MGWSNVHDWLFRQLAFSKGLKSHLFHLLKLEFFSALVCVCANVLLLGWFITFDPRNNDSWHELYSSMPAYNPWETYSQGLGCAISAGFHVFLLSSNLKLIAVNSYLIWTLLITLFRFMDGVWLLWFIGKTPTAVFVILEYFKMQLVVISLSKLLALYELGARTLDVHAVCNKIYYTSPLGLKQKPEQKSWEIFH